jgi:hypothetical protein
VTGSPTGGAAHWLADAADAARCYSAAPCQQWALATAAGDQHRMAAIERQLAARQTAGACRTDWTRDATGEDQLGQAYLLYGSVLGARDGRLADRLARDGPASCAPAGGTAPPRCR